MRDPTATPALLTMPHYLGTLAAARCLGAKRVPVLLAADRILAPATWSKFIRTRRRWPSLSRGPQVIRDHLVAFGKREPGAVLYPTSDDMAWVIAKYADDLRPYFHLYAPPLSALAGLIDKSALHRNCVALGIGTPRTFEPKNEEDVIRLLNTHGPLLVKPRAQAFFLHGAKGAMCTKSEDSLLCWRNYRMLRYAAGMSESIPDIALPLLQEFVPRNSDHTYSISGFIDEQGVIQCARSSLKVEQSPPLVGVGVRFVEAPLHQESLDNIVALCRHLGYFGVFEVEFVFSGDRPLMVDFNPRYYGQMGFDIARGAQLPWLVQLAALGLAHEIPAAVALAERERPPSRYENRIAIRWNVLCDLAAGVVSTKQARNRWRGEGAQGESVDFLISEGDMLPAWVGALSAAFETLVHPRSFYRRMLHAGGAPGLTA